MSSHHPLAVGPHGLGKYVATALTLFAMIWTWKIANNKQPIELQDRKQIETSLQEMISHFIKSNRPFVSDISFQQLYSEDIANTPEGVHEMLVHFRYTTSEPLGQDATEQVFEGSVKLRSANGEEWHWIDNNVTSPILRFKRGSEINAHPESNESKKD